MQQVTFIEPGKVETWDVMAPAVQHEQDALVRMDAVTTCDLDAAIAAGRFPVNGPFPLGHEGVGTVLEVGPAVTSVQPGQRVSVPFQVSCGRCDRCQRGRTATCAGNGAKNPGMLGGQFFGLGEGGTTWGGFLSDVTRVPFAEHLLVPLPEGISAAAAASLSDNIADAYTRVAPGLARTPGAPVLVISGSSAVGLYCVAVAVALGAERVDFAAVNNAGIARAEQLGANIIQGPHPRALGPYPVTVDCTATAPGLLLALRSLDPGGFCASIGFYGESVTLDAFDLLELYFKQATFAIGLPDVRDAIPPLIALIADGRLHPEIVTAQTLPWDQAAEAVAQVRDKLLFVR